MYVNENKRNIWEGMAVTYSPLIWYHPINETL
jgi:hypothetical protein